MKYIKQTIFASAMTALALLTSCGNDNGKPISEFKGLSSSDSVSYYYGQLVAGRYGQMMQQDSAFKSEAMRKAYWEGMQKGLNLYKNDDSDQAKAYNEGLTFGLQMATMMAQTHQDIPDYNFSQKYFGAGFHYSFSGDTLRNLEEAQRMTTQIMGRMEEKAQQVNKKNLEKVMTEYAAKNGFKKSGNTYIKVVKAGKGPKLAIGDSINLNMLLKASNGKNMSQFDMHDNKAVLGKTLPLSFSWAGELVKMQSGADVQILIDAIELFGPSAKQLGFGNTDFVIVTLQPTFLSKTNFKQGETKTPNINTVTTK